MELYLALIGFLMALICILMIMILLRSYNNSEVVAERKMYLYGAGLLFCFMIAALIFAFTNIYQLLYNIKKVVYTYRGDSYDNSFLQSN